MEKLKFADLDHVIEIDRANLQIEGQELFEFAREIMESVARSADSFGARPGQVFVRAIFPKQVIVLDEGNQRHVRLDMKRDKTGSISFRNAKVVRQEWIEQGDLPLERSENTEPAEEVKSKFVSVEREINLWGGIVGTGA